MKRHDIRASVIADLTASKGEIPRVAREVDMSYDTVLRIANQEGDPGYSKVLRLYEYFAKKKRKSEIVKGKA